MRLWTIIMLTVVTVGCNSVSPKTERQIALLRAEILDLGNQYSDLKSRHRSALNKLQQCTGEQIPSNLLAPPYYNTTDEYLLDDCPGCDIIIDDVGSLGSHADPLRQPFAEPNNNLFANDNSVANLNGGNFGNQRPFDSSIPQHQPSERHPTVARNVRTNPAAPNPAGPIGTGVIGGTDSQSIQNVGWEQPLNEIGETVLSDQLQISTPSDVAQIFINPENTMLSDFDGDNMEDGLTLLVQPLDNTGTIVPRAGDVVVSVVKDTPGEKPQRIGFWKFASDQVLRRVTTERGRRGLLFELPWQRSIPQGDNLVIFVRYINSTGQSLETSLDILADQSTVNREVQPFKSASGTLQNDPALRQAKAPVDVPEWRPIR